MAARDGRRARRLALHEKIHRLRRAGHAIRAIARRLQISRTTVYKYLSSPCQLPQAIIKELPCFSSTSSGPYPQTKNGKRISHISLFYLEELAMRCPSLSAGLDSKSRL